jgi:hypothetical protein
VKQRLLSLLVACLCFSRINAQQGNQLPAFMIDMVHHNPGEPLTRSTFNSPAFLKKNGFNGQVMNDFIFVHAAITYHKFDSTIFLKGTKERIWVEAAAKKIKANIIAAKKAGIKVYYFTDIIVLPKKLVDKYKADICDANGKISFERPLTIQLHKLMLDEVFETFPDLDGLVIRTGETYTNNVPYHTGNDPITSGPSSHIKLIQLLRDEVCEKRNKTIIYRTWSFGGMHDSAAYYLAVVNNIQSHKNLIFSIKHTRGDYQRTYPFNPCIGAGNHKQIIEVQCQREYEGKGAYPNYVIDGVVNGFEENVHSNQAINSLKAFRSHPNFAGVYSWSRGGGWVGPYITNEFWCKLNAFVIKNWVTHLSWTEVDAFNAFMDQQGIFQPESRAAFRQLALLSAKAIVRGHMSVRLTMESNWAFWMRDQFLAGIDTVALPYKKILTSEGLLYQVFSTFYQNKQLQIAVNEKKEAVAIWDTIVQLSKQVYTGNKQDDNYIRVSAKYGLYLHQIIASGWEVMALGFVGDKTGKYDTLKLKRAISSYDKAWYNFKRLKAKYPNCASLYEANAFLYTEPTYRSSKGMGAAVNKYRVKIKQ